MAKKNRAEFKTLEKGPMFKKSEGSGVRISIISIDGEEMIDIRQFYKTKSSAEWLPTSKGFTLPLEKSSKVLKKFLAFVKSSIEE